MNKIVLSIKGMYCSACSSSLTKYLNKQDGIVDAYVNLVLGSASITYNDSIDINDIYKYIKDAGYESLGLYDIVNRDKNKYNRKMLIIYTILLMITMIVSMGYMFNIYEITNYKLYTIILILLCISFIIYGYDIIRNGIKSIIHLSFSMDTLVTISVLSSFIYSIYNSILIMMGNNHYVHLLYFESICMVIYFVKLGRYIESISHLKTSEAISSLVSITPNEAIRLNGKSEEKVTIDMINKGDILLCKSGEKIAVDGDVIYGKCYVDESFINGESLPSIKERNSKVVAGSININGIIKYKAVNIGKDSTISSIVRLVMEATNTSSKYTRIADYICSIFVPLIILISIITFIINIVIGKTFDESLIKFVSILVVSCPCALGLATPLCVVVSEGVTAKNGILVKSSETFEKINKLKVIVFDKTGTLTYGKLKINKIYNYSKYKDSELLKIVGSIEKYSNHPISSAFDIKDTYEVLNYKNINGVGINGIVKNNKYYIGNDKLLKKFNINDNKDSLELKKDGNSIMYIISNKELIGIIGVKDIIRDNACGVINKLNELGYETIMLTGDNKITANVIGKEVGIKNIVSDMLPKDKLSYVSKLKEDGKVVMMVGDGINDAPSLATADIGVSIGSGTDIANNSSSVILLHNNLNDIINLINISKKTVLNIKENLAWAFIYNIIMISIACGLFEKYSITINPMIGSIFMTISSITVVLNALRLKNIKIRR